MQGPDDRRQTAEIMLSRVQLAYEHHFIYIDQAAIFVLERKWAIVNDAEEAYEKVIPGSISETLDFDLGKELIDLMAEGDEAVPLPKMHFLIVCQLSGNEPRVQEISLTHDRAGEVVIKAGMNHPVTIEAEGLIGVRVIVFPAIEQLADLHKDISDLAFGSDRLTKLDRELAFDVIGHGRYPS
jgi:hypothetical protein